MKYGIDMGHNAPPDTGAVGIKKEDELTVAVGTRVISKLQALGHQVVNCTPKSAASVMDSLSKRCTIANANDVDVFVSIHFNSYNGRTSGAEVWYSSSSGQKLAQPVLNELLKLGYVNRGIKQGNFYVLVHTDMPSILVECCFIDSADDMKRFDPDKTASAIVAGLTGGQTAPSPTPVSASDPEVLKLQQALNRLKVYPAATGKPLTEDGKAGPQTKQAKQRLKTIFGLSPTETAASDRAMWEAITSITVDRVVLRPNHGYGPAVRYLQFRLNISLDGLYAGVTVKAVMTYQSAQGLSADGVVGPATWGKLVP
jgi:N-acetylmuramoyl-L-alanine amidase